MLTKVMLFCKYSTPIHLNNLKLLLNILIFVFLIINLHYLYRKLLSIYVIIKNCLNIMMIFMSNVQIYKIY
jgi:hypothetical protein